MQNAEPFIVRASGESPLRFVLRVASGRYRWWMLGMLVGEAANAACGILLPFALSRILTRVTKRELALDGALGELTPELALFGALCIGELVFGRINSALQLRVAPRQRQWVARELFAHLHGHSYRFLNENFAGALAHRIGETSHGVNQVLWALLGEFWPITIVVVVSNLLLWSASGWLCLFASLWTVGFVLMSLVLSRRTQPLAAAASTARSATAGAIVDSVTNHTAVRFFAALDYERQRLDDRYASELGVVLRANMAMEQVRLVQFAGSAVLKAGIVALAVYLWSQGRIDIGQFVMAVSLSLLVIAEVRNLSRRFLELFEYLGNVGSGVRAILREHEHRDAADALDLAPVEGAVRFSDVHFSYPSGRAVFRGLSVDIPRGQRVGLVGASGSGKSTFVSLLLRLYEPQQGVISLDGRDTRTITQASLRRSIGVIPQDPMLFHRTLRDNIRFGRPEADDTAVSQAAARALADVFIAELPHGYDAEVGERGVKLSGGQRQRIAIARVALKNAPILILDEATASLDSVTERAIQNELDGLMGQKTAIVIAHRLSTIAHLDRILVFDAGAIVEDGTHEELLARGGKYAHLWNHQSGAERSVAAE